VVDLTTTNVLLGILAGVALLQMTFLIVGGIFAWRAYNGAAERVDALERKIEDALAPLAARAHAIAERFDRVAERVDTGTEKLDHALAVTSHGAQIAMAAVNGNVQRTAAFAAALARGGRAALRAWRARSEADREARERHAGNGRGALQRVESPSPSSPYIHTPTEESHVSI
jgi:hypothetical protein